MTCRKCQHDNVKKFGKTASKIQRFRCRACGLTFTAETNAHPFQKHSTSLADIERVVALLVEGVSIRAISRLTGLDKETILSLLLTVGSHCADLFDALVRNVPTTCVQADELWTFVQKKQKRLTADDPDERGDQYIWIALDAENKLVVTYYVGKRTAQSARAFMADLRTRLRFRPQVTTDGLGEYVEAVELAFGSDADFAQCIKNYAQITTDGPDWFRPSSRVTSVSKIPVSGDPDGCKISTSHVERANLTMRMHTRRLTRLTNAFSKKLVNLEAAIAIFMAYYNFCRVHQTLRVTPAMEAGLTNHAWTLHELLTIPAATVAA